MIFSSKRVLIVGLIDQESRSEIILDGKTIAIKYLKGWFVIDALSSLPIDYIFLALGGHLYTAGRAVKILRLTKILQLLRLLRISRLVRYIQLWQEVREDTNPLLPTTLLCSLVQSSGYPGS